MPGTRWLIASVFAEDPGLTLADQDVATVGACHTANVPYWFDTLDNYNMFRPTRAQDRRTVRD